MKQRFTLILIVITILCTSCSPASRIESCKVPERNIAATPNFKLLWSESNISVHSDPLNPSLDGLNSTVFAVIYKTYTSSQIMALDVRSGEMKWQRNVNLPVTIVASDTSLYMGSYDTLHEYDSQTGNVVRETNFPNIGNIYNMFVNDQTLYALSSSGQWLIYNLEDNTSELSERFLPYTPFITDNGILYLRDSEGFKATKIETGETLWRQPIDEPINLHPLFVDNMIIILSETGNIYALDKESGNLIWKLGTNVLSNVAADTSRLFFLTKDGYLKVLDIGDGQELQNLQISSTPFSVNSPRSDIAIGVYNIWADSQDQTVIFSLGDSCQLMALKLDNQ